MTSLDLGQVLFIPNAPQDRTVLLGPKGTLLVHGQLVVHWVPQETLLAHEKTPGLLLSAMLSLQYVDAGAVDVGVIQAPCEYQGLLLQGFLHFSKEGFICF